MPPAQPPRHHPGDDSSPDRVSPSPASRLLDAGVGDKPQPDWRTRGRRRRLLQVATVTSFLFSLVLIAWAFTLPRRKATVSPAIEASAVAAKTGAGAPEPRPPRDPRATLTAEEYLEYSRQLDRRLLNQVREKQRPAENLPGEDEVRRRWQGRIGDRRAQLQAMRDEFGEEAFREGTLQWQTLRETEAILADGPLDPTSR